MISAVDAPDALAALAEVDMHAMQTSGNLIRNVTADHFAGAAVDEIEDPRSNHPDFRGRVGKFQSEINQRAFYGQWAKLMADPQEPAVPGRNI